MDGAILLVNLFTLGANLLVLALAVKLYTEVVKEWNQRSRRG